MKLADGAQSSVDRSGGESASILKSSTITVNPHGAVTAGLDVDALIGAGDSGALADDLIDLFVALAAAAEDRAGTRSMRAVSRIHGTPFAYYTYLIRFCLDRR
ncbi:MAG: hypothetical protein C4521_04790 [Actinobacteria bacterium]|nr:MAG: hypothetical protein C4521_04790 [Actinomycetota bacterium]